MRFARLGLAAALGGLLAGCATPASQAPVTVTGTVRDRLRQPIADVTLIVTGPRGERNRIAELGHFQTDTAGAFTAQLPAPLRAANWTLTKPGYQVLTAAVPPEPVLAFTLAPTASVHHVARLLDLDGDPLRAGVVELLAADWDPAGQVADAFFHIEDYVTPPLTQLTNHPVVGARAKAVVSLWHGIVQPDGQYYLPPPWRPASAANLEVAATLAMYPVMTGGEARSLAVSVRKYNRRGDRVVLHCYVSRNAVNARGYTLVFRKVGDEWVLIAAGLTWLA